MLDFIIFGCKMSRALFLSLFYLLSKNVSKAFCVPAPVSVLMTLS